MNDDGKAAQPSAGQILYLDDEEPLVFLVTRLLRRMGYEPLGFSDPAQALAAFKSTPARFVLVMTDLSMPGANGLDFAAEILAVAPEARVAVLTGHVYPADIDRARALGVRAIEQKPLNFDELGPLVQRLLR
jgi:two-component system cell cycle sensor histidine kinase/response regulator CckA